MIYDPGALPFWEIRDGDGYYTRLNKKREERFEAERKRKNKERKREIEMGFHEDLAVYSQVMPFIPADQVGDGSVIANITLDIE